MEVASRIAVDPIGRADEAEQPGRRRTVVLREEQPEEERDAEQPRARDGVRDREHTRRRRQCRGGGSGRHYPSLRSRHERTHRPRHGCRQWSRRRDLSPPRRRRRPPHRERPRRRSCGKGRGRHRWRSRTVRRHRLRCVHRRGRCRRVTARAHRCPRQQRGHRPRSARDPGHLDGQHGGPDGGQASRTDPGNVDADRRAMGPHDQDAPVRHLLRNPGGPPAHGTRPVGPHRQHRLDLRHRRLCGRRPTTRPPRARSSCLTKSVGREVARSASASTPSRRASSTPPCSLPWPTCEAMLQMQIPSGRLGAGRGGGRSWCASSPATSRATASATSSRSRAATRSDHADTLLPDHRGRDPGHVRVARRPVRRVHVDQPAEHRAHAGRASGRDRPLARPRHWRSRST